MRSATVLLVLISATAAADPAPAPVCFAPDTMISEARLAPGSGDVLELCGTGSGAPCWSLAVGTGAWSPLAHFSAMPRPQSSVGEFRLTLCTPDGSKCVQAAPPTYKEANQRGVATNADLSLAVTWKSGGVPSVDVVDTKTWKTLSTIKGWKTATGDGPAMIQYARFLGSVLEVVIAETPASHGAKVFDPKSGKKIAPLGKAHTEYDDVDPVDLGGGKWAFVTFDSKSVVIVEPATGTILRTIPLPTQATGATLLAKLADGKQLVVVPSSAKQPIYVVDPDKRTAKPLAFTACKP